MPESLRVSEIMTTRVVTIGLDDTLQTARELFARHGFHHLIVLENGRPFGVVSDRDLLRHLSPFLGVPNAQRQQDVATLKRRMHQVMTRELISVPPDCTVAAAARLMIERKVSCLPVIAEDQGLIGILTMRDVVRYVMAAFPEPENGHELASASA